MAVHNFLTAVSPTAPEERCRDEARPFCPQNPMVGCSRGMTAGDQVVAQDRLLREVFGIEKLPPVIR